VLIYAQLIECAKKARRVSAHRVLTDVQRQPDLDDDLPMRLIVSVEIVTVGEFVSGSSNTGALVFAVVVAAFLAPHADGPSEDRIYRIEPR